MTTLYPNDEPDVTSGITDDAPMETTSPLAHQVAGKALGQSCEKPGSGKHQKPWTWGALRAPKPHWA